MAKLNMNKQRVLPPLRTAEVLASLAYVVMAQRQQIRWTEENLNDHLTNLAEWLVDNHVLPEGQDDVVPF